ncbi:MAG: TIGR04255 family protein [Chloroflexi bacterium]|nr:TIGR04255 family protein [Chloroflexota bacterium]
MGRIYRNAPIIEAFVEFQFVSEQWDWTVPGLMYEKLQKSFPKKRQQNVLEVAMQAQAAQIAQRVTGGIARMQFVRDDDKALIQVGPDLLAVNYLRPYPDWPTFRGQILEALSMYREIAAPTGLKRMGLRYINRVEIPEPRVELEQYFRIFPTIPMTEDMSAFLMRVEVRFEAVNGLLVMTMGSTPSGHPERTLFILDLDFFTVHADRLALESASDWIEAAHTQIEHAFESCITDKARALFQEVKS